MRLAHQIVKRLRNHNSPPNMKKKEKAKNKKCLKMNLNLILDKIF